MKISWAEVWQAVYERAVAYLTQPAGGVGVVTDLGSGYSVEGERSMNIDKLRDLQLQAVLNPDWMAHDITGDGKPETFCNRASLFIAQGMGCQTFTAADYANDMIGKMEIEADWTEDTIARAHAHAMKGGLAFLVLRGNPHGHLCSISPEPLQDSGSWAQKVPIVANVGTAKSHGIVKASMAFTAADKTRVRAFLWGAVA